jgi:hypothetical protein
MNHRIALIAAFACMIFLSCFNPFFPPSGLPPVITNKPVNSYLRSTPQGVVQQLINAYEKKDINQYKDLFSAQQDFRFYVAPNFTSPHVVKTCELVDSMCYEIISKGLPCAYYWTYTQEMISHTNLFEQADEISLMINPIDNQDVRYITNGNRETTNVEIVLRGGRLDIAEPVQYDSDGNPYQDHIIAEDIGEQVFYLEHDPQNAALWVIYKWFDLGL